MSTLQLLKNSGLSNLLVLLKRLFVVFVIYQITRVLFYYINIEHFTEVTLSQLLYMMLGGLRFDLTAIIYINSLFIILSVLPLKIRHSAKYQTFLLYLFLITNAIGYAFNILDIYYFDYILKRSTIEIFMFVGEGNMGLLLLQFLKDFWMGLVLFIALIYITKKHYSYIKHKKIQAVNSYSFYIIGSLFFLLTAYFSIIGIRGGFTRTTRPISLNNAGIYTKKPLEMAIVLNTPFSIIRTLDVQSFSPKNYYPEKELIKIYNPVKHFETDSTFTNQNVVIFIVESLAKEYFGSLNTDINNGTYQGYTPFLDSLITVSHTFTNAFANGRKSIDALPSVVASVPSLVQPFILSPYSTNNINGIGSILKKEAYKTAFFHGAPNGSMGFDAFMNMAGHDEYYGYDEYNNPDDFDGNWGIWDEEFLQFTAHKLNEFKTPFLASIFTLSSHHPFKIPEKYKGKFKKGTLPIHQPIQYTDNALRKFFTTASKMPWFENTIFVITADHCNQTILPEYKTSVGAFSIPIIIYQPNKPEKAKMDSTIVQQADILPRVLRELNYSGDFVSFGTDIQTEKRPFAVNFKNQTWQYYEGDYLLQFRDEKIIGLYQFKTDRLLYKNLQETNLQQANYMLNKLKAYIQQYYNRLIENKMIIPTK
jgi:phosphoglycerol transferase MdoB-like AlkP superfamily enzyme